MLHPIKKTIYLFISQALLTISGHAFADNKDAFVFTPVQVGFDLASEYIAQPNISSNIEPRVEKTTIDHLLPLKVTNSYYVERRSYSTRRETDPPNYVKHANKTWLKDAGFEM